MGPASHKNAKKNQAISFAKIFRKIKKIDFFNFSKEHSNQFFTLFFLEILKKDQK